jgi:glycosyltransferase involved in cell wall biosynthesis
MSGIKERLEKFRCDNPEISIVIPSYNEESNLLRTLSSLSRIETDYKVELIVSNNNSTDRTQDIIDACGVKSVFAREQGISYARQTGLEAAKGQYILNADSDSIYPPFWVNTLVKPLMEFSEVSCAYGTYSFIPSPGNSRFSLGCYEMVAESFFRFKKKQRECVNVMGFNFAFKKEDGLKIGGFDHNLNRKVTGRSEDGWMAFQLLRVGKLFQVMDSRARVWTSDRRLMEDGSLGKAFQNRARKELRRLSLYFNPSYAAVPEADQSR